MATKKCINGHLYDPAIYGDKCPFCPSGVSKTRTINQEEMGTMVIGDNVSSDEPTATVSIDETETSSGPTIIRHLDSSKTGATDIDDNRKLVGLLVSYSASSAGEVYKVYEGRTTIGRSASCDISFPKDSHMSAKHLLIQYVEAKGSFRAQEYDKGSANGSFVNGQVYVLGDVVELKDRDVIVIGGTKLMFLTIPEF